MVIVYALKHPKTGKVCYVGKTQFSLSYRLSGHLSQARNGRQTDVAFWIRGLWEKGLEPVPVVLIEVEKEQGANAEKFWIEYYILRGHRLKNMTIGGYGSIGYKHTEVSKAKIRAKRALQVHTPESNAKRSAKQKGVPRPEAVKKKIAAGHLGIKHKPMSEEGKKNIAEAMKKKCEDKEWLAKRTAAIVAAKRKGKG